VKNAFVRWLPAITSTPLRKSAVLAAGLAIAGGAVAGPATAAQAAPAAPAKAAAAQSAAPKAKELNFRYRAQSTYYYCAPAATSMALSTSGHLLSQPKLAALLGTTENGTDSAYETTRVLNQVTGTNFYRTREIPGGYARPWQMDRLQADVVRAIGHGYGVVANVKGTAYDTAGGMHSFEGGHYIAVVGYQDEGRLVKIADSAEPNGDGTYWMTTIKLANWIAERGYSA
jgi:hypothetical protein